MPASVPPAPSLPGLAQTFASTNVLMISESFSVARPLYATVATFETDPAAFATTVNVNEEELVSGVSVPTLQVIGPVPVQPAPTDTNDVLAGRASLMLTVVA